ncbi:MAG: hypothetical protein CM15mP25_4130 [Gammaproteobacteria bacterium]|nr:MAG: hypothetical protein CM15mP25_4130 [Gammaproteobacteria bacterium]
MDVLAKYGVEAVDPQGEPFDPETAQAMSMVEQPTSNRTRRRGDAKRLCTERPATAPGDGDGVQGPSGNELTRDGCGGT